jgi:hypothetical protein
MDSYLFKPALAYRVRRDTYTDTPMPPDEPMGKNPPDGAIIDYFLGPGAKDEVTLEILDSRGVVVRRYASTDKPDVTQEQLEKQLIPLYWLRTQPTLSRAPGMHRWVWDLHYPAPDSMRHEYPISAVPHDTPRLPLGPAALPGEYTVKLIVDGFSSAASPTFMSSTAPLIVKMDPRVKISTAALEQQFKTETRLASMMTHSTHAIMEARSLHDQLEKLASHASTALSTSIKDLEKKTSIILDGPGGNAASATAAAPAPTLTAVNASVTTLYNEIDRADAAPTSQQAEAVTKIDKDFEAVTKQWSDLKSRDLPALNRQLGSAGQPEIHLDSHPETQEDEGQDID